MRAQREQSREENDEYMELRRHCSQTYQRHSLLRRQFHQSSRPQPHYRVFIYSLSFPLRVFLLLLLTSFFHQEMHAHRDSPALSPGLAGSFAVPFILYLLQSFYFNMPCLSFVLFMF